MVLSRVENYLGNGASNLFHVLSNTENCTNREDGVPHESLWHYFVYASVGSYICLVILAFIFSCLKGCYKKTCRNWEKSSTDRELEGSSFGTEVQEWAESVNMGHTLGGRMLVVFIFMAQIVSMLIYLYDTCTMAHVEVCTTWQQNETLLINFALGIIIFLYFLLRALGTENFLNFIFELETIVDFMTLPPLFLSIWLERSWIGLRFFRFLILVNLPDILVYVGVLTRTTTIRLTQLFSYLLASLFWYAGVLFLIENSGDPWEEYNPDARLLSLETSWSYLDSIWFLMVTASTVGYGDICVRTSLGKLAVILYLLVAIASFANYLPEIAELLGNRPKYGGSYKAAGQRQFVVVCGNINYESVNSFLSDFFHSAREDVNCEVVFLNRGEPDLEFEGLLKREKTRVTYFQGTMLNPMDLQRVAAEKAAAVLVLCNKFSSDPCLEDASNIMRVISLKNYCESTRVVIQLLQYQNKAYLLNIPGWDWRRDDQAVCLNEVKYGLLAQSCLAPGFFTMACNIVTSSYKEIHPEMPQWKQEYMATSHKVILAETLSPTFVGFTFQEVAETCYLRLNLVLLAIEARKYEGGEIWINPKNKRINPNAIGLFMTDSSDAAKRAWFFCRVCHDNVRVMENIKKCQCKRLAKARFDYFSDGKPGGKNGFKILVNGGVAPESISMMEERPPDLRLRKRSRLSELEVEIAEGSQQEASESAKMTFDSTGCFHWCSSRAVEECTMTRQEATVTMFSGHIIVAIFAEPDSPLLGLRNLMMPLRASNINYNDLRHIIILGNERFISREWSLLKNLPKISVLDGSPMSRADLRAIKINFCRTCIILSAKTPEKSEPVLADKEVIMAALNIKTMKFSSNFNDSVEEPTEILDNSRPNGVPILLDLAFASNVRYLDDHEMYLSSVELYKTLPYASGVAMARGILDSLMSATYFNASALRLLRQLVTGGANFDLEMSLAEGAGLRGGYSTQHSLAARHRVRVEQIVLKSSPWSRFATQGAMFGDLFSAAIRENGTLCLSISRLLDEEPAADTEQEVRVVLGCPDNTMKLQANDHIIALVQWEEEDKEKVE